MRTTNMKNAPAVVILSGGMDSATLLHKVYRSGYKVYAVSFNYGQRHKKELECAKKLCSDLDIEHKIVDLTSLQPLLKGSALTDDIEVPEGHYEEKTMKATVVPNRNMIMASIATGYAVSLGAKQIFMGIHAGDHAIYPDCRKGFVRALNAVLAIANYQPVRLVTPYIDDTKRTIIEDGMKLGVPYKDTLTCYKGGEIACGKCGSCQERLEAFGHLGLMDPIEYETRELLGKI